MTEDQENETGAVLRLRLPLAFKAAIEGVAKSRHISVSALTRLALLSYIKDDHSAEPTLNEKGRVA